jgi:proteasome lid subunit RPN8/RPN11
MKIQVSRKVLNGFRARALKKYPSEYLETVWGTIGKNAARIVAFYPIEHKATPEKCQYEAIAIDEQREKEDDFPEGRLKFLGTIHSHPDGSQHPSESDWETSRSDGDLISGIYQILPIRGSRKKTRVTFYSDPVQELEIT